MYMVKNVKGFHHIIVSSKIFQEEVWEVVAQLVGLALGILILVIYRIFQDGFISYFGSTKILLVGNDILHFFSF